MRASQPNQRLKRLSSLILCAGWSAGFVTLDSGLAVAQTAPATAATGEQLTWADALRETARGGRPSLVLVTSSALPSSGEWASQVRQALVQGLGERVLTAELTAESDPVRIKSLNVRSIPTALLYVHDPAAGLKLAAFHQGELPGAELLNLVTAHVPPVTSQAASAAPRRVVRVQLASASTAVSESAPSQPAQAARDSQVSATTLHAYGAQASAQGSPQSFGEPPGKQMPPSPVKTAPPQQSPPQQQAPPLQAAPPAQPQPVYGYYQPQPVYSAPPSSPPVMVQPPAGQVVVQPSPLNVMVAPAPPPQVTYMAPAMAQPMFAPAPAAAPPANAFTSAPPAAPQPAYAAAPPAQPAYSAPQPAMGAGLAPSMMMTVAPNLLDRFLGGLGRVLAERGNPRLRMSAEMPAYFAAPAGVAAPPVSPLQAYMAVPNGGDDATEAYLKAYIALCKEKGIKPTLPGMEQPPGGYEQPPTGPVPSPQGQPRKKGWFH